MERKWWVLVAVGVGSLMASLDASVANIVLPIVSKDLHSDIPTVEWVVTMYLLVVSGLLLSFGRLGDLRGHKTTYLSGFFLFVLGSALCGISSNIGMLIACRALQACGAAMLYANSPAIITSNFPASQRGQALGLQATMTYLGLTIGPSLGGWLTEQFSWHAVFYINVPIGALAVALSWYFIPQDEPEKQAERFDWSGAALFTAGLIALLLGLNQGSEWGWGSPAIVGSISVAIVLIAAFLFVERRVANPMLDLSLFGNRLFSAAAGTALFNYVCIYAVLFLLPFYLIQGRGLDPASAGIILTAQPLVMAISAPISGTLSDRIGSWIPSTIGMGIMAIGLFLLSQLGHDSPLVFVGTALAIVGLGTGIFVSPNNSALMGSAPRHRQGIASGILATSRNVGMVLGVGLAGAIFTTILGNAGPTPPILYTAIDAGFMVSSGVAALGMMTSAVRGT